MKGLSPEKEKVVSGDIPMDKSPEWIDDFKKAGLSEQEIERIIPRLNFKFTEKPPERPRIIENAHLSNIPEWVRILKNADFSNEEIGDIIEYSNLDARHKAQIRGELKIVDIQIEDKKV